MCIIKRNVLNRETLQYIKEINLGTNMTKMFPRILKVLSEKSLLDQLQFFRDRNLSLIK